MGQVRKKSTRKETVEHFLRGYGMDDGMRKASIYLGLWQANLIGLVFGYWLFNGTADGPIRSALMVLFWLAATHYVWCRVRRVFWPEDAGRF